MCIAGLVLAVTALLGTITASAVHAAHEPAPQPQVLTYAPQDYRPVATGPEAVAPAPMGDWTPRRGVLIAQRALRWVGWPYSFAGGDADGPTFGTPVDHDSRNDGRIRGFDCSGLVIYALAPFRSLHHFAATQYGEAGTAHPGLDALQPGDLLFWSKDGTVSGVGHVAIYVGDGRVVQAPESGARITVTSIGDVEPGRIGVTRPLS